MAMKSETACDYEWYNIIIIILMDDILMTKCNSE